MGHGEQFLIKPPLYPKIEEISKIHGEQITKKPPLYPTPGNSRQRGI
jgi:hypothetical protein